CSQLLKGHGGPNQTARGRFAGLVDKLFQWLRRYYEARLHKSLEARTITMILVGGVLLLTGIMYASTPRELAPDEDQGFVMAIVKPPPDANRDYVEHETGLLHKQLD